MIRLCCILYLEIFPVWYLKL